MRRRLSVVLALVAALAFASGGTARADGAPADPTVTIAPSGGGSARTLSLSQLAGSFDVHDATYVLRAADGTSSTVTVPKGISLGALITAAGLDGDPFTYVEVPWADGTGSSYVLADHVGDAVVWADAQGAHFLRLSSGGGDANADDDLTFPDGTVAVDLHTGSPLLPRIGVSTLRARPHQSVRFSASLAAGSLAPGMQFSWYFDGDGSAIGAHVSHRFSQADSTYTVVLNVVRGSQELTVLPAVVRVRVVSAPVRHTAGAQGGGTAQGSVTGGASGGTGVAGSGDKGVTGPGGVALPRRATPTVAAASRGPRVHPPRRLPPTPQGRLVSGTLIAAASAASPFASDGRAAGAASAAPAGAAARGPLHVPVGAWVAIGLAVLLGLGWALESRHTFPFWQP